MSGFETDTLRHALQTAREMGFRVVKLGQGDHRFVAILGEDQVLDDGADGETEAAPIVMETQSGVVDVVAPVVGYFRSSDWPLEPGKAVEAGDILGEVVALGLGNDVVASCSGKLSEVFVEVGQPVEYGQKLVAIECK